MASCAVKVFLGRRFGAFRLVTRRFRQDQQFQLVVSSFVNRGLIVTLGVERTLNVIQVRGRLERRRRYTRRDFHTKQMFHWYLTVPGTED